MSLLAASDLNLLVMHMSPIFCDDEMRMIRDSRRAVGWETISASAPLFDEESTVSECHMKPVQLE